MRKLKSRAWSLALVPFVLAACGGADTADDAEEAMEEAVEETTPEPATFMAQVVPLNDSGVTGQVELRGDATSTELHVVLTGAVEGEHQGHIHAGTCEAPGDVVAPLSPLTADASGNGEATSTVEIPLMTVMNGQHIVVYHDAGGTPGTPRACAAIPTHQM